MWKVNPARDRYTAMNRLISHLSAVLLIFTIFTLVPVPSPARQEKGTRGGGVRAKDDAGREVPLYKESHALLIGVSEYDNGWDDLSGVKEDIPAVKRALERHSFEVDIEENPTGQQLEAAIKKFIRKYGEEPDNRLLIYFAGHGHTLTTSRGVKLGYLVPRDAPSPSTDIGKFKEVAVSMNAIEDYALQIESKHALFVFDSCFAGTIFDITRASHPPVILNMVGQPVREFITAGGADEVVPNRSVFREQFVEGLEGAADLDGDGYITGSELGMFLKAKVSNYTKGAQTPQWGTLRNSKLDKGDFVFQLGTVPVVKNSSGGVAGTKPTAPPITANGTTSKTGITPGTFPYTLSVKGNVDDDPNDYDYDVDCVGEYRIDSNSIRLTITRMTLRAVSGSAAGPQELISIRFGLGIDKSNGREWKLLNASREYSVNTMLNPGEVYSQTDVTYSIPINGATDLSSNPLVLEMKTRPRGKKDTTFNIYVYNSAGVFTNQRTASGEVSGGPDASSIPRKPDEEDVTSPSPIPHGPKDLKPHTVYTVGDNKTELVLRALTVESNDDEWLRQTVSKVTKELTTSGSHAWDDKWCYWRLQDNAYLLLAWATPKAQGWVLVQKYNGAWWYKTNSGQWKHIKNGESEDVYWVVEGSKVSIAIEALSENTPGWSSNDIKYKFGQ